MRLNKQITISFLALVVVLGAFTIQCAPRAASEQSVDSIQPDETAPADTTLPAQPEPEADLVYMLAGDVNMLALAQNLLATGFKEVAPDVNLRVIHTGPGEAGSRLIFEKMMVDKESQKSVGDVDVATVHQVFMTWAMEEGLLLKYASDLDTYRYVTAADAHNALGVNVEGYVVPMFHSQTALAYNPALVDDVPSTYAELVAWVESHPGMFGYNGIEGGASGVSFVVGWVYWKTGNYEKYAITGPFEAAEVDSWQPALEALARFNTQVTKTSGNVGTLEALNRGDIAMGPVWVDMFYTYIQEGKLDPSLRLTLLEPGMPGQPMYFVIPANAPHPELAKAFIEYVTSPEVQGQVILDRYNWYPGIDGKSVKGVVPLEAFDRLYHDISPETLSRLGLSYPLSDYFEAMLEAYRRWVPSD